MGAVLLLMLQVAPVWATGAWMPESAIRAVDAQLESAIVSGYPGVVALVATDDAVLYARAVGYRDLERRTAIQRDAIFRIYSMTKPIISAFALMLVDEGLIGLDVPVARYLPAFSKLHVLDSDGQLRALARPMTVRHLLTHTSGLAIGGGVSNLPHQADPETADNLADYVSRLARLPLAHDPGTVFAYDGTATRVLSRIMEVVSGQALDALLHKHLFTPLGMQDTGFEVPENQRIRVVDLVTTGNDGYLQIADNVSAITPGVRISAYANGAGDLYSTVDDYLRFCRMLLAGGIFGGRRYLRPETVHAMMTNQLDHPPVVHARFRDHEGFGFGLSVLLDWPARGWSGPSGQSGWSGAASTEFMIDPQRGLIMIMMAQYLPRGMTGDLPRLSTPLFDLVQRSVLP